MNKKNITKAITSVLLLLLLVGVIGIIAHFTNGFKEDFKTFYVTYADEDIMSTNSKLNLPRGDDYRFDVTYTFEFVDENEKSQDYNVKIVSNVDEGNEFTFTVDGETKKYTDGMDLSKAFSLKKQDTYFVFTIPEKATLQSILHSIYGGTVVAPDLSDFENSYLFSLVVSSYDESVTYNIDFSLGEEVTKIQLYPNEVVF